MAEFPTCLGISLKAKLHASLPYEKSFLERTFSFKILVFFSPLVSGFDKLIKLAFAISQLISFGANSHYQYIPHWLPHW